MVTLPHKIPWSSYKAERALRRIARIWAWVSKHLSKYVKHWIIGGVCSSLASYLCLSLWAILCKISRQHDGMWLQSFLGFPTKHFKWTGWHAIPLFLSNRAKYLLHIVRSCMVYTNIYFGIRMGTAHHMWPAEQKPGTSRILWKSR